MNGDSDNGDSGQPTAYNAYRQADHFTIVERFWNNSRDHNVLNLCNRTEQSPEETEKKMEKRNSKN